MRWRWAPGAALRERAGPDAEVTSVDIILVCQVCAAKESKRVIQNDNVSRDFLGAHNLGAAPFTPFVKGAGLHCAQQTVQYWTNFPCGKSELV
jgi:hypothetical protein